MSDPLEARRQELLGDAEFARLAESMGADTDQKRAELARNVAEAFSARGQIETDQEDAAAGQEPMSLQKYVQWWGNKQKAGGKRKKLSKKARKQSRGKGSRGPFAAAAKQKLGTWSQKLRPAKIDEMPAAPAARVKPASTRRPIVVAEERGEPCKVTWAQAEGRPETAVPLERLPGEVRLHEGFPEPIRFDAEAKQLVYRGFLITSSFRYLLSLSSDLDYIRAIHELNTRCVAGNSGTEGNRRKGLWLVWVAVALGAAAGLAWMLWR